MILGIYGYQDSGKTTMAEQLIKTLVKKGMSVASIKHTRHPMSVDQEGKDTWRHWKAGSNPVVFASGTETTVMNHSHMRIEDVIGMVMAQYDPDVLLIEGCKDGEFPKISVGGIVPQKGTSMSNPTMSELVKHITSEVALERKLEELPGLDCLKCGYDCEGLAKRILAGKSRLSDCKELSDIGVDICVGGERIASGKFVSEIVDDTVRGMLSSLKGYKPGKVVEIRLEPKRRKSR